VIDALAQRAERAFGVLHVLGGGEVAALERLRQLMQALGLGGLLVAHRGDRAGLALLGDREIEQDRGLDDHERGVDGHHRQAAAAGRHQEQRTAGALDGVEDHVVHRDHGGADHDHAPVAVDEQEGEHAEDVEVQLDRAVGLLDEEHRERHEADGHGHARDHRARVARGERQRNPGSDGADHEGDQPRAVQSREPECHRHVGQQEQGHRPVRLAADLVERASPAAAAVIWEFSVITRTNRPGAGNWSVMLSHSGARRAPAARSRTPSWPPARRSRSRPAAAPP
jgi:hypothetical protein